MKQAQNAPGTAPISSRTCIVCSTAMTMGCRVGPHFGRTGIDALATADPPIHSLRRSSVFPGVGGEAHRCARARDLRRSNKRAVSLSTPNNHPGGSTACLCDVTRSYRCRSFSADDAPTTGQFERRGLIREAMIGRTVPSRHSHSIGSPRRFCHSDACAYRCATCSVVGAR